MSEKDEIHEIVNWPRLKEFFKRHKNKKLIIQLTKLPKAIRGRYFKE